MNILIGVTASIAIYKSCDLVRELTKKGHQVKVVMTRTAANWINPLVFSALSGQKTYTQENNEESPMAHIDVRENLDLYLIAPATADLISRAANASADDIVTATLLSYAGERWLAPSMNPNMLSHAGVKDNMKRLEGFGYRILDPADGEAVCGDLGAGKMMGVSDIIDQITDFNKEIV